MSRAVVLAIVLCAACEQGNGDPAPPTVVSAPTSTTPPPPPPAAPGDAGTDAPTCAGFASPTTSASCHASCKTAPCNANGCFGDYWCDLGALKCVPKPSSCP